MLVLLKMNVPAALGSVALVTAVTIFLFISVRRDDDGDGGGESE